MWWLDIKENQKVHLAFFDIDMANSKNSSEEQKEAYRKIVGQKVEQYNGFFLNWQGDRTTAFFYAEKNTEDTAAKCAIAIRTDLILENLEAHIGINCGTVNFKNDLGTINSSDLDVIGRLEGVAPSNIILIAQQFYEVLSDELKEKFNYYGTTSQDKIVCYCYLKNNDPINNNKFISPDKDLGLLQKYYFEYLINEHEKQTYPGILQITNIVAFNLLDIFEPIDVKPYGIIDFPDDLEKKEFEDEKFYILEQDNSPKPFTNIFNSENLIAVIGDPGAGKTTLLKWLCLIYAVGKHKVENILKKDEWRLPIFASIGELYEIQKQNSCNSLIECLGIYYKRRGIEQAEKIFKSFYNEGKTLILLDGLDELGEQYERINIARFIKNNINSSNPLNKFVITSHMIGFGELSMTNFKIWQVLPFNNSQIERFLKNWYVNFEISQLRNTETAKNKGELSARKLFDVIKNTPAIKTIAINPLLLSLIAIIHRQGTQLPRYRVKVYELISQTLIEMWDKIRSQSQRSIIKEDIDYTQEAQNVLIPLGLWMQKEHPEGIVEEKEIKAWFVKQMQEKQGIKENEAVNSVNEFFKQLKKRTHLIIEKGKGYWGFMHLTFQEYFAASAIVSQKNFWDEIKRQVYNPRWEEVILLVVSILGISQNRIEETTEVINNIFNGIGNDLFENVLYKNRVLAGKCIAEGVNIKKETEEQILFKLLNFIISEKTYDILVSEVLLILKKLTGKAKEFVINKLYEDLDDSNVNVRTFAVQTTIENVWGNKNRYFAAFALSQIGEKTESVINVLLEALDDNNSRVRGSAAYALGVIGKSDQNVINALFKALDDKNVNVQRQAAYALGVIGKSDQNVINALFKALDDKNSKVRGAAAYAFEIIGKSDQNVINALLKALDDNNSKVRSSAAYTLCIIEKSDQSVINALLKALYDKNSKVRGSAAYTLGIIGKSDKKIIDALIKVLLDDQNLSVKSYAARALSRIGIKDERCINFLFNELKNGSVEIKRVTAFALGRIRQGNNYTIIRELHQALNNNNSWVVKNACFSNLWMLANTITSELQLTLLSRKD